MSYILKPYDDSLQYILDNGVRKANRTGISTLSVFGYQCRYNISDKFPILTGRKVYPSSIIGELLWIISGSTNIKDLQTKYHSNIWNEWDDPVFQQEKGYVEGSLGPVYGFQLRHFNGSFFDGNMHKDHKITRDVRNWKYDYFMSSYGYDGIDQLKNMVDLLKKDPDSRRNLFSLWNPSAIADQKLACCHILFQVYVHDGKLSGQLYQRSCDAYLGCPANLLEYSALLYMLAQQTGLKPYEFIHSIGDFHLYENSIEATKLYLSREKPDSPILNLRNAENILSYKLDDFVIENYNPLSPIKVEVAV